MNASAGKPSCRTAAAESPPPTTVSPLTALIASASARVPAANAGNSNTPAGPFQNTVFASASFCANSARVCRAHVQALPVGRELADRDHPVVGVRREPVGGHQVHRQHDLHPAPLRLGQHLGDLRDLVRLEQRLAHLVALGGQERVGHAAAR